MNELEILGRESEREEVFAPNLKRNLQNAWG